MTLITYSQAFSMEPIRVSVNDIALDITDSIEVERSTDGSIKKSTAPDADGIVRRIEVRSKSDQGVTFWAVFALANTSDEQIDRYIVAPHYQMVGSRMFWPDLDDNRISSITPSEGFTLDKINDSEADVFLVTLDPGAVLTLIAEQNTDKLPKLFLWEPSAYKDTTNSYTLYRGIVLGIAGLLAVFLTILFVIKGSAMFPATACLAWGVLAYICVDFGFWSKVVSSSAASEPFWRAGTEVFLAASLIIFVYVYLGLNRWHQAVSSIAIGWILSLIILMGISFFEPQVAAGLARLSLVIATVLVGVLIIVMAVSRYDRAIMLIPTWIVFSAWVVGAGFAVSGNLSNDIIQPALSGGLVLVVLLLCFTVMQHAFTGGAFAQGLVSDTERYALALVGSGDMCWDWDVNRDRIIVSDEVSEFLKLDRKTLNTSSENWQNIIHPNDRGRFDATLGAIIEHKRGRIAQSFRLRGNDGQYQWLKLRARPMLDSNGEVARCIGTLSDVNDQKKSQERILQDSVRDSLTGLENQEVFTSRLETIMALAKERKGLRPTLYNIDIDRFNEINAELGFAAGDTILMTLSRRLQRLLSTGDSLARLAGDQFVLMVASEADAKKVAGFADAVKRAIRAPIDFAGQDLELTASIGIASYTLEHELPQQLLRDAELAKIEAKRHGGDRVEPFRPSLRTTQDDSVIIQQDLKRAIDNNEIHVFYQPILNLNDRTISGFEALMRWHHPKLGLLMPQDFVPEAERSGMINQLGNYVLNVSANDFAALSRSTGQNPFVSVNISSRELLQTDIVSNISIALEQASLPASQLRLEVTESMVMENPEHTSQILNRIKALGVGISLDDFGTGYSSLSYLLKFPFDTIKIDKSFVQARMQNERLVILRSIIAMAHSLDQSIIAEGAEYESDVTDLLQLGCEYAQGYLFGEPMNLEDVTKLLLNETKQAT